MFSILGLIDSRVGVHKKVSDGNRGYRMLCMRFVLSILPICQG